MFKLGNGVIRVVNHLCNSYLLPRLVKGGALFLGITDFVQRFTRVQKSTSLTRKFLKLFNVIVFVRLIYKVLKNEKPGLLKGIVLGRLSGLFVYFAFNYFVWSTKVGLLKMKTA